MAKTAAQLVPLKTQLAQNMALFRFADATTDFAGNVAYQDWTYDNSGASHLTANGTSGAQPVSLSGAVLPTVQVATPAGLAATVNNSAAAGLYKYNVQQYYHVAFYDSSNRESQPMVVTAQIPVGTTTGSVTFNFSWPAGATGAVIYKAINSSGCYRITVGSSVGSVTDNSAQFNGWTNYTSNASYATGTNVYWSNYYMPSPNSSSTAPTMSSAYCNVVFNTSGGGFRSSAYAYGVTAYNTLGETLISSEVDAVPVGAPLFSSNDGVPVVGKMNTISTATSTASGTLPIGKYYYKVTAYTSPPPIGNSVNWSQGGGWTESLPSTEVNVTTTGVGQVTLTWTSIASAAGYAIYRSNDLVNPTATTTATATTGGTIPASTTYYYVVTATNANGETMASNEVSQATGSGTATNTITVNWNKVPNAYGYKVYRGTATGAENTLIGTITNGNTLTFVDTGAAGSAASLPVSNTATGAGLETYLTQVANGATTSWIDAGSTNAQNSGFMPPTQYNGTYGPAAITLNWNAPSTGTAVGYNLYRNSYGNISSGASSGYWQITAPTVTYLDNNSAFTGTKLPVQANLTNVQSVMTVGRYLLPPANLATGSPYTVITKLGFTFSGVPGKSYRFFIWDQSSSQWRWNSGWFVAPSSQQMYYEIQPNLNMNWTPGGDYLYFGVQGSDGASYITWQANQKATSGDAPNTVQSENGTWIANGSNYNLSSTWVLGGGNNPGVQSPVQVITEATAGSLPMKVVFRNYFSGSSINGTKGTFLGGSRWSQYALSPNTSYAAAPVKSIVPTWSIATPTNTMNNPVFSNRWATVEVSTDGGSTFSTLTNNTRFVFPSAATQLQFRYTMPQNSCAMSFDRRIMTGLPANDSSYVGANYYFTTDTGQQGYYYQQQSNGNDAYLGSNGNFQLGTTYSNWMYNFWSVQGFSVDVDLTCTGRFWGSGNFGLRYRNDGSANSYGGYFAYIDNSGNAGLIKANYTNTSTTLVTSAGATTGALGLDYTLRVICIGQHHMVFVNGRLVIDYTDTATGNYLTGTNVGLSGGNGNVIKSFQATALSSAYLANSPAWELEYVAAYLET